MTKNIEHEFLQNQNAEIHFEPTRILDVKPVSQTLAWPLVKNTREGSSLWDAIIEWRQLYQEKQAAQAKLSGKLSKKNRQLLTQSRATLGRRLARAYGTACNRFEVTVKKPDILREYGEILEAFAAELGLDWENTEKKTTQYNFFSLLNT